jgi:hypothetical protein
MKALAADIRTQYKNAPTSTPTATTIIPARAMTVRSENGSTSLPADSSGDRGEMSENGGAPVMR